MEQMFSKQDFQNYLQAIGLPKNLQLSISLETLYLLANKQFIYLHYQNHELHLKQTKFLSLKLSDLVQRLCVEKQGGLCYEHELLLYYALLHLSFDVNIVRCQVREAGEPYKPEIPSTHAFLIIKLQDQLYLADPGFGLRSPRFPILLNFEDLSEIHELFFQEHYKVSENETHYQLQQLVDGKWVIYYDFPKPLNFATVEQIDEDYKNLFTSPQFIGARDSRFMICKNTEEGKIQYIWFRLEKEFTAFKKKMSFDKTEKIFFKNYQDLQEDVYKELNIKIFDFEMLR